VIFRRPTCAAGIFASDIIIHAVDITAAAINLVVVNFISNLIYNTALLLLLVYIIICVVLM
jgi:hypothetical protein